MLEKKHLFEKCIKREKQDKTLYILYTLYIYKFQLI